MNRNETKNDCEIFGGARVRGFGGRRCKRKSDSPFFDCLCGAGGRSWAHSQESELRALNRRYAYVPMCCLCVCGVVSLLLMENGSKREKKERETCRACPWSKSARIWKRALHGYERRYAIPTIEQNRCKRKARSPFFFVFLFFSLLECSDVWSGEGTGRESINSLSGGGVSGAIDDGGAANQGQVGEHAARVGGVEEQMREVSNVGGHSGGDGLLT